MDSPRTVCCRSRDPAGYRRMQYQLTTKDSAVLEFVGHGWMGVAVYRAGDKGGSPQHICHWAMYRQGKHWLLAVSYSMGTPACCKMLFGVRFMGSNLLKYTPCGLLSILTPGSSDYKGFWLWYHIIVTSHCDITHEIICDVVLHYMIYIYNITYDIMV